MIQSLKCHPLFWSLVFVDATTDSTCEENPKTGPRFFRANLLADLGRINHLLQFVQRLGFFSIEIHTSRASGAVRRWVTIGKARNSETTMVTIYNRPKSQDETSGFGIHDESMKYIEI